MNHPTKTCNKCKERKPIEEFHINRSSLDGLRNDCKRCRTTPSDGFYSVYYLPEHNYVGMTKHIKGRMQNHRKKGKTTEGYKIIGTYDTAIEAHYVETKMHLEGYEGFHYYETKGRKVG